MSGTCNAGCGAGSTGRSSFRRAVLAARAAFNGRGPRLDRRSSAESATPTRLGHAPRNQGRGETCRGQPKRTQGREETCCGQPKRTQGREELRGRPSTHSQIAKQDESLHYFAISLACFSRCAQFPAPPASPP
ncbi:hypothetical protein GCM10009759_73750 [Kitasatospora saccharophila]|uniref:Uncharacterized protein n=1 Tax=Kitasatospora saccharophila TaxID=407973 RepID=A0ABP5JXG9_9ACTN